MRDLGLMGESTFSLWCADAGLIANGSRVDRTGWDYFVEFPFDSGFSPLDIHKPAFECKVQVKATDKRERKLSITLSNLRRLITAQMPAFFVFMEFDSEDSAQRAYVVHVDNSLISRVLKKLHETAHRYDGGRINKKTMVISYDDNNLLERLNGKTLKDCFIRHIGRDYAKYIANKKAHLESTGYEDGFAQITFETEGEENLKTLIDVSLGLKHEVSISKFKGTYTRFGLSSVNPNFQLSNGKLAMPDLKPTASGSITFKDGRLSAGLSFNCKLYISPFNQMVPQNLRRLRVEGEFFDLKFNPYTGAAIYSFSIGEGVRMEVGKFRDVIKLITMMCNSESNIFVNLVFDGFPKLEFKASCNDGKLDFSRELKTLELAVKLMSYFDVSCGVDISLGDVVRFGETISQMAEMVLAPSAYFKIEFGVSGHGYDPRKETACVFLVTTPIGSHVFGVVYVITGVVDEIEGGKYALTANNAIVEQKIVSERDGIICKEDLVSAIEEIEKKYGEQFSVVTIFDKNADAGPSFWK